MKKLAVLLVLGGMLMLAASMAQAHPGLGYYQYNPAKICDSCAEPGEPECCIVDGYTGPRVFIFDSTETDADGCTIDSYTVNCSFCHVGEVPGDQVDLLSAGSPDTTGNDDLGPEWGPQPGWAQPQPGPQGPFGEVPRDQVDLLSAGSPGTTGNDDSGPGWDPSPGWSGPKSP